MFICTEMATLGQISQENPCSWDIILHYCAQPLNWGPAKSGVFSYKEHKWQMGFADLSNLSGPAGTEQNEVWIQWVRDEARTVDHSLRSQGMGGRAEAGLGEKGGVFISLLKIGNSRACLMW